MIKLQKFTIACISVGLIILVILYALIARNAIILRLLPVIMPVILTLGAVGVIFGASNSKPLTERKEENESD